MTLANETAEPGCICRSEDRNDRGRRCPVHPDGPSGGSLRPSQFDEPRSQAGKAMPDGPTVRYEWFRDAKDEFRFTIVANNGEPVAQSEGYRNKEDCFHAIRLIDRDAIIVERTGA